MSRRKQSKGAIDLAHLAFWPSGPAQRETAERVSRKRVVTEAEIAEICLRLSYVDPGGRVRPHCNRQLRSAGTEFSYEGTRNDRHR
jgi:hypothetical protein